MTQEKYLRTVMHLNFKSGVLFCENLMGCKMGKIQLVMNKPVYLSQTILDLSNIPARFDTSGYCPNQPLPVGLNKKVIGLMKDELGGKIITEFVALRPKLYSYIKS